MTEHRSIFPVLGTLLRRRRMIVGVTFVAAILAGAGTYLIQPTYAASASFVADNSLQSRLPAGLSGLASQLGVNLGNEASRSPAFYADLLRSKEILSGVLATRVPAERLGDSISVSDLYNVSGSTTQSLLDEGIKALQKRITVAVDQRTDVVHVTVEAPRPEAARDVLQLLLDRVFDFNVHTRQSAAGERRKFIEGRVASAEDQLRGAEDTLRLFYERNRQYQSSPQLRLEEQELNRQVTVQQDLYLTLRREYETARIDEVNNTPVLTVIDHPTVPGRRIRPQRTITVLLTAVVIGILVSALALMLDYNQALLASGDAEYGQFHQRLGELVPRVLRKRQPE